MISLLVVPSSKLHARHKNLREETWLGLVLAVVFFLGSAAQLAGGGKGAWSSYIILCYILLYYTILHYIVLYCIVLYYHGPWCFKVWGFRFLLARWRRGARCVLCECRVLLCVSAAPFGCGPYEAWGASEGLKPLWRQGWILGPTGARGAVSSWSL